MRQRAGLGLLLVVILVGGTEARAVSQTVGPPFDRGGAEEHFGCYSTVSQPLDPVIQGDCGFNSAADAETGQGSLEVWVEAAGDGEFPSLGSTRGAVVFRDTFEVLNPVESVDVSVEWFIQEAFATHTGFLYRNFGSADHDISGWARFAISSYVSKADCWQCQDGSSLTIIEAVDGGDPAPPIQNTLLDGSFKLRRIGGGLLSPGTYDLRLRAYGSVYLNGNYQGVGDTGRVSAGATFQVTKVSIAY